MLKEQSNLLARHESILTLNYTKDELVHSQVNGLITSGDNKLDNDSTPATNPCAFPYTNN